jgi:hypothetical protein
MKKAIRILSALSVLAMLAGCGTLGQVAGGAFKGGIKTYTFYNLPETLGELQSLPEANLKDPYGVAALTIAALCRYETNPDDCFRMLNWLKGEEGLSANEREFLRERLQGKAYKPRSFFAGATPQNNYTPSQPNKLTPVSNPQTFRESGMATVYLRSSGAEDTRQIKLRQRKETGEWFLYDIQCLSDMQSPVR